MTRRPDKQGARHRVADHVGRVGVKRERGDGSPPLSGDNAFSVDTAALEPNAAVGPSPCSGKKRDQQEADGDTDRGRATNGRHRSAACSRRVGNVFPVIGVEGLASSVCITGGNDERPAIESGAEPMGNAARCEHCGPFVNPVAVRRQADGSSSEILHLPAMIDAPHVDWRK